MTWLEGDRLFTIVFGTISAAACLSIAIPTLYWCLPDHRTWVFGKRYDPRQYVQLGFGLFGMAMAFANALCRYIPHRQLGVVHPTFFIATLSLMLMFSPLVVATSLGRERPRLPMRLLTVCLAILIAAPIAAVVQAFWV